VVAISLGVGNRKDGIAPAERFPAGDHQDANCQRWQHVGEFLADSRGHRVPYRLGHEARRAPPSNGGRAAAMKFSAR
jgi:hypothetical protein